MNGRNNESSSHPFFHSRLYAWLQLLRLPNLLTVPGDPLAGFLLAAGASAVFNREISLLIAASVLFYAGGLLMNDVVDLGVDRVERPRRPLPSGRVSAAAARNVAFSLFATALGLCVIVGARPMRVGAVLCALIMAYNVWLKKSAIFGPLCMGACRSFNLLLGASAVGVAPRILVGASAILAAYVTMIAYIARKETSKIAPGWFRWIPPVVVLAGMCLFVKLIGPYSDSHARMTGSFFLAFMLSSLAALQSSQAAAVSSAVGLMISALLGLQSAFCLGAGAGNLGLFCGFILLALWPLNRLLSRWFYGS